MLIQLVIFATLLPYLQAKQINKRGLEDFDDTLKEIETDLDDLDKFDSLNKRQNNQLLQENGNRPNQAEAENTFKKSLGDIATASASSFSANESQKALFGIGYNEEENIPHNLPEEDIRKRELYQRADEAFHQDHKRMKRARNRSRTRTGRQGKKKTKVIMPISLNVNLEAVAAKHPFKVLRPGSATDTDSCEHIRDVPSELRSDKFIKPGVHISYKKYTEAYGIPILGSSNVTDNGMRRACYVIKIMFASRYDLRNAYRKLHGRVSLIGDGETTTSIHEYRFMDKKIDTNTRGIGPSILVPVTSAGDDNQRCTLDDILFDQDILVHELAHGVHQLAAQYVIPGFQQRLKKLYDNAMAKGKYTGKYPAKNLNEYFAVAAQFYFNSYIGVTYKDIGISNRDDLRVYDPDIVALMDEVFPCAIKNNMVERCGWKECLAKDFNRVHDTNAGWKSNCEVIYTSWKQDTPDKCARLTCHFLGNAFNWKVVRDVSTCIIMKCKMTNGKLDLQLEESSRPYNIYAVKKLPEMDYSKEKQHRLSQFCTKPPKDIKVQCKGTSTVPSRICGAGITKMSSKVCSAIGCCWTANKCYMPNEDCVDKDFSYCPGLAALGECRRNPGSMLVKCPVSCNICSQMRKANLDKAGDLCQDVFVDCPNRAKLGQCSSYKNTNCKLACGTCKLPTSWSSTLKVKVV